MGKEMEKEDRKKYYEFFVNEVIKTRRSWRLFECILGYDFEKVKTINNKSLLLVKLPVFTDRILHGLMQSVLMALSRLSDPMETMGKKNVTLERLMECIEHDIVERIQKSSLKRNVNDFLKEMKTEKVKNMRNKIFSHNSASFIAGDENITVELMAIGKLVRRIAKMGEQIKSINEGTGINISTGRGMHYSGTEVAQCEEEVAKLYAALSSS